MVTIRSDEISNTIRERIEQYNREVKIVNTDTVLQVGNDIARIRSLDEVMAGELVEFEKSTIHIAPNLESNNIGVILIGDSLMIQEGSYVKATKIIAQIPVSEAYLSRVINALAKPIDGRDEPLETCLIAIDSMIPIGRATNTIMNKKGQNVICVYVAIGQKASSVAQVVITFQEQRATECIIVVAEMADSLATLQYLAPYTGAALAEYFMYHERHTLIVHDDPSKQAQTYRQMSLLLSRLPATKSSSFLGKGSMSALPIVETQSGDVSTYIPTNVIFITDGQIVLSADLFNAGIWSAINMGIFVSRVGSTTEIKALKQVADKSKLELAQFAEGQQFRVFSQTIPNSPLTMEEQIVTIYTGENEYLNPLEIGQVKKFLAQLRTYLRTNKPQFQKIISSTWTFFEEAKVILKKAIQEQIELFLFQEQT
ncbi:hypothetical protein AMTRI_Chr05g61760 [Amborella trichopoda]